MTTTTITIETVKEYNSKQDSMCMIFSNNDGSEKKRGFVANYNGTSKLCKTLTQAESLTASDFEREETPNYWNADLGMSNLEALNS